VAPRSFMHEMGITQSILAASFDAARGGRNPDHGDSHQRRELTETMDFASSSPSRH